MQDLPPAHIKTFLSLVFVPLPPCFYLSFAPYLIYKIALRVIQNTWIHSLLIILVTVLYRQC